MFRLWLRHDHGFRALGTMSSQTMMNRITTKMGKTARYAGERRSKDVGGSFAFALFEGTVKLVEEGCWMVSVGDLVVVD